MTSFRLAMLVVFASVPACTTSLGVLDDRDAARDAMGIADAASEHDAGDVGRDAGGMDAGVDAGVDADVDVDAGVGVDAGVDADVDVDVDAGVDAGPSHCGNGGRDGDETDSDCGGSCTPCAIDSRCAMDSDCVSDACDATSLLCVADQCTDHRIDGAETDADCGGGSCVVCATGRLCRADTDCTTGACDTVDHVCVINPCSDHHTDRLETDVDCGGGTCSACPLGDVCAIPEDCASIVCDAIGLTCISNGCVDHRVSGMESDVDCGGSICVNCMTGQHCNNNGDCQPGHVCFSSTHLCS